VAALATAGVAACSDNLESNAACPTLCPGQSVTLRDTVIDAVIVDSSVAGFPAIGQESYLLVSTRGDTIDSRAIIRFDSLATTFARTDSVNVSPIVGVDSAYLMLRVDTTERKPGAPITVSVYDVGTGTTDSSATDTAVAVLGPLFNSSRLLGSRTFAPESLVDSLRIPLSRDSINALIAANNGVRVGIQVTGSNRAQMRIGATSVSLPAEIVFKPAPPGDTTGVTPIYMFPYSRTPVNSPLVNDLQDYVIVLKGTANTTAALLTVGGLPGHRVYLRFNLPSSIVDSTTVVRATLLLNQVPNPVSPDPMDSATVYPEAIVASSAVTDLTRALRLVTAAGQLGLDTLERFAPADSGLRQFEMVQLVRAWHADLTVADPRAIALVSESEGLTPSEFWFTSSAGPTSLRPKIHLYYTALQTTGISP